MAEIILPHDGWEPMAHQVPAWNAWVENGCRENCWAWHRRAGKDDTALHGTAVKLTERVGTYYHCLPIYAQARKVLWEAVNPDTGRVRWKDAFPEDLIAKVDNQSMMIRFHNGSHWHLVGSDNQDSLMGAPPVGVVFSEVALANPATFGYFRPILLQNNGWSVHVSSVRGRNHFHRLYESFRRNPKAFASHLSAYDTGIFTHEQLESERQSYIDEHGAALGESLFNQEFLSSWDAAIVGAVFGKELDNLEKSGRACPLIYDPRYPVDTAWDIGVSDQTVILFFQEVGNIVRLIDWYAASDNGLDHFADVLRQKRYSYRYHIGPHDIAVREWGAGGISRIQQARRFGIKFMPTPRLAKSTSIGNGAMLIRRMEINVSDRPLENPEDDCSHVLSALKQYRFSYDQKTNMMSKAPVHDWTSHYADALMTYSIFSNSQRDGTVRPDEDVPEDDTLRQFDGRRVRDILAAANRQQGKRSVW